MSHQQAIDLPPLPASQVFVDSDGDAHGAFIPSGDLYTADQMRAAMRAAILADRSRSAAPVAVPEGFMLVPREPTEAMILAGAGTRGMKAIDDSCTTMQLRGYSIDPEAFKGGAPLAQAWRAMLAAAPLATPLAPAETMKQLQIAEEFANSLCGMIGDISNALGISEEEQSCANGAEEILDAIEELKRAAPAEAGEVGRLADEAIVPAAWWDWLRTLMPLASAAVAFESDLERGHSMGWNAALASVRERLQAEHRRLAALAAPPGLAPLVAGVGEVL